MTSNFFKKAIRVAALAAVTLIPAMACTYSASSPVVGAGGGNTTVQIYSQPGCAWTVTAGAEWLELYSTHYGTGNGTVYVYLPPNNSGTRQAYLNVVVAIPPSSTLGTRTGSGSTAIVYRSVVTEY